MFLKFLPSVVIIGLSIWIFCLQTENKGRLLIVLVVLSGVFTLIKEVYDYRANRPTPNLILDGISSHYDKIPPTAAVFSIHIKNTGNASASDVLIKTTAYCDDKVVLENSKKPEGEIGRGQTVSLDLNIGGLTFQSVLTGKSVFKIVIDLECSDKFGRRYTNSETTQYTLKTNSPIFKPFWVRKTKETT